MKTSYLKTILAVIAIALCACENDPTFAIRGINDNETKVSNIATTSADVSVSIVETESGDYHNYNHKDLEVYYSTSSNPFIESYKIARCTTVYAGIHTIRLYNLESGTTYYYAPKLGNQTGKVRSFTTKGITVETGTATDITTSTATLSGKCTLNGSTLQEAGILVHTSSSMSYTNYTKRASGTYTNFNATITGLMGNTTYYYCAYAKDTEGNLYYGEVKSFKTEKQPPRSAKTAVDLGLSVKWAAGNVGATYETDYGNFYAWGETNSKSNYSWSTYKWCNGSYYTMTKYCTQSDLGKVDNKITLDLEDDAAHVKWGGSWRMPTRAEQDELLTKCTWTWTQKNGINGYEVKGPNGNSIFLPASGRREGPSPNSIVGTFGYCWSSSLPVEYNLGAAYCLGFHSGSVTLIGVSRAYGLPIRPVCP